VPGRELGNNVVRLGGDKDAAWSDMRFLAVEITISDAYNLQMVEGRSFQGGVYIGRKRSVSCNESGMNDWASTCKDAIGQKTRRQNRKG